MLIAARAVQGVAAALHALASCSGSTTDPNGGRVLGLCGGVSGAGGTAGVLLSGVLTSASADP